MQLNKKRIARAKLIPSLAASTETKIKLICFMFQKSDSPVVKNNWCMRGTEACIDEHGYRILQLSVKGLNMV